MSDDYGHDDAMFDLETLRRHNNFVEPIASPFNFDRLADYITRIEAERDAMRDALSWYCAACNTMYPYESVKDANGGLPKCPRCGDYATTEAARRQAYTADLERHYGKAIAERDEALLGQLTSTNEVTILRAENERLRDGLRRVIEHHRELNARYHRPLSESVTVSSALYGLGQSLDEYESGAQTALAAIPTDDLKALVRWVNKMGKPECSFYLTPRIIEWAGVE